jgi:hypothetical protein
MVVQNRGRTSRARMFPPFHSSATYKGCAGMTAWPIFFRRCLKPLPTSAARKQTTHRPALPRLFTRPLPGHVGDRCYYPRRFGSVQVTEASTSNTTVPRVRASAPKTTILRGSAQISDGLFRTSKQIVVPIWSKNLPTDAPHEVRIVTD